MIVQLFLFSYSAPHTQTPCHIQYEGSGFWTERKHNLTKIL